MTAVVMTTRSPASRWRSTIARARSVIRGRMTLLDVAFAQLRQLRGIEGDERRQVELGELDQVGLAPVVAVDQLAVGDLVARPVEEAPVDQERHPLLVAVVRQQRVVEIEECEYVGGHGGAADEGGDRIAG